MIICKSRKKEKLEMYCSDHLYEFQMINCDLKLDPKNFYEMKKFYDSMLKKIDKFIGKKYKFGYSFYRERYSKDQG